MIDMKNFLKIILICAFVGFSFPSCNDMLETKIYTQINPGNFPQTEDDVNGLLASIYTVFNSTGGYNEPDWTYYWSMYARHYGWWAMSVSTTDEAYARWWGEFPFNWGSGFNNMDVYGKIRTVSKATDYINLIQNSPVSDEFKKSSIAQLKCLRGWLMFILYDFYGPLPVILDPEELLPPIHFKPRPSEEEYLGWMIKDLEDAMPDLPAKTNNDLSNWGKVNQGVARMILLKTYMNTKQYDKAKIVCDELMGMGYSLVQDSYKAVFNTKANNEIIYAIPTTVANGGMGWYYYLMPDAPDVELLGIKVPINGWWGYAMSWSFYDTYSPGDKRLETIAAEYKSSKSDWVQDENGDWYETNDFKRGQGWLHDGAVAAKYIYNYQGEQDVDKVDLVVFRYADVLLSKAEIENELSGPAAAKPYLEAVTNRANTTVPASVYDNKEAFKEFLLAERGRELYFEGWRRMDMIRFGKFISWGQSKGYDAKDYMVRFPIPPSVINESENIITQNQGY
jgi:hypothetical protein